MVGVSAPLAGLPVVVTRPQAEADRWVKALGDAGHTAWALPLLAFGGGPAESTASSVASASAPPALRTSAPAFTTSTAAEFAWAAHLKPYKALMFVSAQAVQSFLAPNFNKNGHLWHDCIEFDATLINELSQQGLRCWAPGPGTAAALLKAGVAPACIDQPAPDAGQFDSEALWSVVGQQLQAGDQVLVVRGDSHPELRAAARGLVQDNGQPPLAQPIDAGSGRDWLAQRCRERGAVVEHCVAYQRVVPKWSAIQHQQAQQAVAQGAVWLFSSSEAVAALAVLLPGCDWSHSQALATHPRIAQAVQRLGFATVQVCRPALADVLQALDASCLSVLPQRHALQVLPAGDALSNGASIPVR